jgi:hypothetical protein
MAENKMIKAIQVLRQAKQQETLGYIHLLQRLGYCNLKTGNHADATSAFKDCVDIMPQVTSSPINLFSAQRNLLISLTYHDMEHAARFAEMMCYDLDNQKSSKDFGLILGNIEFFNGKIASAKKVFSVASRREDFPVYLQGQIFNNLAFASWMHLLELN